MFYAVAVNKNFHIRIMFRVAILGFISRVRTVGLYIFLFYEGYTLYLPAKVATSSLDNYK